MRSGRPAAAVIALTMGLALGCASKSRRVSDVRIERFDPTESGVEIELELLDFGDRSTEADGRLVFALLQRDKPLGCTLEHAISVEDGSTITVSGAFQGTCAVDRRFGPAYLEVSFLAEDPKHRLARNLKGAPEFLGGDGQTPKEREAAAAAEAGLSLSAYREALDSFHTHQAMLNRAGHRIAELSIDFEPPPCGPPPAARDEVPVQRYGRILHAADVVRLATYMDGKTLEPVPTADGPWAFLRDPALAGLAYPHAGKAVVDALRAVDGDPGWLRIVEVDGAPEGTIEGRLYVIDQTQGEFLCVADWSAAGGEGYEARVRAAVDAMTPELPGR